MKKNLYLCRLSALIFNIGLPCMIAAYLFVLFYTYRAINYDILILSEITLMLENITMSLLLIVAVALITDIHIKHENRHT